MFPAGWEGRCRGVSGGESLSCGEPLLRLDMDVYAVCGMRYCILVVVSCECILSIHIHLTMQIL